MADVDGSKGHGDHQDRPRERWLAVLAAKQHGVVAHPQLLKLGFSRDDIRGLTDQCHLQRLYRGVYAVGHKRLTTRGRWMAAVLAGGPNAVLSHRAAIALWDLRPVPSGPIDVTVPGRKRDGQGGVRIHNVRRLHDDDRTTLDGIPVTAVHRTLLDYAEVAYFQQLRHALDTAERRDLLDGRELDRLYERSRGRHGLKPLKAAVAELQGSAPWTQSELERQFLALIRAAGLPEPQTNVFVEGFLVDCWWPEPKLVVELDGYEFHKSRQKFASDRVQDTKLQLAGCMTIRVTQDRIENEPGRLLADVIRGLRRAPAAAASGL
jgi:very-short-patch-repair endonuclease